MESQVTFSKTAAKQFGKLPYSIAEKLTDWADVVEVHGLAFARQRPGFHDEPLKGRRAGERSIRLNRSWRAIYQQSDNGTMIVVEIQEITHHDYRTR